MSQRGLLRRRTLVLLVLVVVAGWVVAHRVTRNWWVYPPPEVRPTLAGVTALVLEPGPRLLTDPKEINAFRTAAFSEEALNADVTWLDNAGIDGSAEGLDKEGNGIFWAEYHSASPLADRFPWVFGHRSGLSVEAEQRYFPLGERWRKWLTAAVAAHPPLREVELEVPASMPFAAVLDRARELGLAPEGGRWGSHSGVDDDTRGTVRTRYVQLFFRELPSEGLRTALQRSLFEGGEVRAF
jgi:hypothetical protein